MFFRRSKKLGLEKAKELGLITELELLKLKSERAEADLKKHIEKNEGHKKRKK